jgi:hypothetical protein
MANKLPPTGKTPVPRVDITTDQGGRHEGRCCSGGKVPATPALMSTSTTQRTLVGAVLVSVVACTPGAAPQPMARILVRELESPPGPGSGEPSLTLGPTGGALLTWIEPQGDKRHVLKFASRAQGAAWSPSRVIAAGNDWFVNWADFPAMATLPDGTLFAHWLAKSGAGRYAYDVRVVVSRDGGTSWSAPIVPHRDGTQTEHGFVSMTPWGAEQMGIVWLDGRKTVNAAHSDQHHAQAEMSLMHSTVGREGRLGQETVLDGRVCDCCQTDAVQAKDATVVVYRDRTDKEIRDMSVVRFTEGRWSEPRPLAHDGWQINGCPVNGPAIAAAGPLVAAAWFAAPNDKASVKVTFSADSGATFGAPIVVDQGRPLGRVDVVLLDGGVALVSWLEQGEKSARLRVRRVHADGTSEEPSTVAESSGARSSGFPRMVRAGGEVVIAWRDAAEPPRVRTAALTFESRR